MASVVEGDPAEPGRLYGPVEGAAQALRAVAGTDLIGGDVAAVASVAGSLTVNITLASGTSVRPDACA